MDDRRLPVNFALAGYNVGHPIMTPDSSRLAGLFTWPLRERRYQIAMVDGDEYIMRAVVAGQDHGEAPHAVGSIVERIRGSETISPAADLFFMLEDIAEVRDAATGEILYRAG